MNGDVSWKVKGMKRVSLYLITELKKSNSIGTKDREWKKANMIFLEGERDASFGRKNRNYKSRAIRVYFLDDCVYSKWHKLKYGRFHWTHVKKRVITGNCLVRVLGCSMELWPSNSTGGMDIKINGRE